MRKTIGKLLLLSILTLGLALLVYLAIKTLKWLWRRMHGHWAIAGVVTGGLIVTLVSVGFYLIGTVELERAKATVNIQDARFYIDDGLLSNTHYVRYMAMPTNFTQPDTVYRIDIGNGIVSWSDKTYWSELELYINKPKVVKNKITQDEYNALGINPSYNVDIVEVKSERNFSYLVIPFLYTILVYFLLSKRGKARKIITKDTNIVSPIDHGDYQDIMSVLRRQFKYKVDEAKDAVSYALSRVPDEASLERKIMEALRYLGR